MLLLTAACGSSYDSSPSLQVAQQNDHRWSVVWRDDFEGDVLDRSKWAPEQSCWGGGNNERQCYTDRQNNVSVRDGVLYLRAQEEAFTGPLYPEGMSGSSDAVRTQEYTSGKVRTRGLASWKYGRFSARIRVPRGLGTWPAFWMMPEDDVYGSWPLSGEIDIMEAINIDAPCVGCPGGVQQATSAALHFGDTAPGNTYLHAELAPDELNSPAENWRIYSLEWGEGVLQWFVDEKVVMRLTSEDWYTATEPENPIAPFDQAFYLMLNLAVGGNLPERSENGGFDPASFPASLQVDWVQVEQCTNSLTGRECLTDVDWKGKAKGPWEEK